MPAVARDISIIYNGVTVGGTTDSILDGEVKLAEDHAYGRASVSFSFWTFATTQAAFITQTNAFETAFTTPRAKLEIKVGGTAWRTWDPVAGAGGNTGFWQAPTIRKTGGEEGDTVRSRRYEVTIEIQTPADLAGQAGRLNSTVSLEVEQGGRRRVVISGRYTALAANNARAQYLAAIGTYQTTVCDALIGAGLWELTHRQREDSDDADKNLDFVRIYREILLAQSGAALNDPDLVDQVLVVARGRIAPGDVQFPGVPVARLQDIRVSYEVWVPGAGVDLRDKWESVIRPWILDCVAAQTLATRVAVVAEDPSFDYGNRRITASMSCVAPNSSDVISASVTTTDAADAGAFLAPVWNGDPFAKHVFRGPATLERTITTTVRRILTAGNTLLGVVGSVANVSAVKAAQQALGIEGAGTHDGSPSTELDFGPGGSAAATGATLVPSPQGPVGGSANGFVQIGPQITVRTPATLGLVSTTLDVVDEQTTRRLQYRKAPT